MRDRPVFTHTNLRPLQVNQILTSPLAETAKDRSRYQYRFLRVTRLPTHERPDSGRILVENLKTGKRDEFYAILFSLRAGELT